MKENFNVDNCNKYRTLIEKGKLYEMLNTEENKLTSSLSTLARKESKEKVIDYSQRAEKIEEYATGKEVCKGCKRFNTCDHKNK